MPVASGVGNESPQTGYKPILPPFTRRRYSHRWGVLVALCLHGDLGIAIVGTAGLVGLAGLVGWQPGNRARTQLERKRLLARRWGTSAVLGLAVEALESPV